MLAWGSQRRRSQRLFLSLRVQPQSPLSRAPLNTGKIPPAPQCCITGATDGGWGQERITRSYFKPPTESQEPNSDTFSNNYRSPRDNNM